MKKRSYILLTLIICLMILILPSCDPDTPVSPTINVKEPAELSAASKLVEEALLGNDATTLISLLLPKYVPVYSEHIYNSIDVLSELGTAFKKRKLIALDRIYAVYQVEYGSSRYEISFSLDNEGYWKLTNF